MGGGGRPASIEGLEARCRRQSRRGSWARANHRHQVDRLGKCFHSVPAFRRLAPSMERLVPDGFPGQPNHDRLGLVVWISDWKQDSALGWKPPWPN